MLADLAPYLAGMLERASAYGEPFVGGASVALYVAEHFHGLPLHLNDKDPLIASLWRVISGANREVEALVKKLDVVPTLSLWHSINKSEPTGDVERAFKAVFMNRTSWNGIIYNSRPIGGLGQKSQWPIGCRYTVNSLTTLVHKYHALLAGRTTVTCLDAVDFMRGFKCPCYIDPPYLMNGRNMLYGVTMTESQHRDFAEMLRSAKKWLLTYDMKDKVASDLYWGSDKKLIDTRYSMDTAHHAHRRKIGIAEWKKASEICVWKGFLPVVKKDVDPI